MVLRVLALIASLAVAACDGPPPAAAFDLAVQLDEVFLYRSTVVGSAPLPASTVSDANDDDPLVTAADVPLGSDLAGAAGCRSVAALWLGLGTDDMGATGDPRVAFCVRMPTVTYGGWRSATARVEILPLSDGGYRVNIAARHLVANAVYSAWIEYSAGGRPFAIAPVGGAPNLIITDGAGQGRLSRALSSRQLRSGSLLANVVRIPGSSHALQIDDQTSLRWTLYYHSDAQSNGNAAPMSHPAPPDRIEVPGVFGIDAHLHLAVSVKPL